MLLRPPLPLPVPPPAPGCSQRSAPGFALVDVGSRSSSEDQPGVFLLFSSTFPSLCCCCCCIIFLSSVGIRSFLINITVNLVDVRSYGFSLQTFVLCSLFGSFEILIHFYYQFVLLLILNSKYEIQD